MTGPSLVDKVVRIHHALDRAGVPHAFGGALALAYCTEEPRATRDIDLNVFAEAAAARSVLAALPDGVGWSGSDVEVLERDGQHRLWWDITPLDLFFDTHPFHRHAAHQRRVVPFADTEIPVLDGTDLVVFKAFFDRPKDWVDIDEVLAVGGADARVAGNWLADLLGPDDHRTCRFRDAADRAGLS